MKTDETTNTAGSQSTGNHYRHDTFGTLAGSSGSPPKTRLRALGAWNLPLGLLLLALAWPIAAQAQYEYTSANGEITITGYTGPGGRVVIPATLEGLPVTRIGDEAFAPFGPFGPTSVIIPNSVVSIGSMAFAAQFELRSVTIGNSVASIGDGAFADTALTRVNIPGSVTSIGEAAFTGCFWLQSVTLGYGVITIGDNAFSNPTSAIRLGK